MVLASGTLPGSFSQPCRLPRFGPRQIRAESAMVRRYNASTGAAPFDSLQVADIGDVNVNLYNLPDSCRLIRESYQKIVASGCVPLTLGKDPASPCRATASLLIQTPSPPALVQSERGRWRAMNLSSARGVVLNHGLNGQIVGTFPRSLLKLLPSATPLVSKRGSWESVAVHSLKLNRKSRRAFGVPSSRTQSESSWGPSEKRQA